MRQKCGYQHIQETTHIHRINNRPCSFQITQRKEVAKSWPLRRCTQPKYNCWTDHLYHPLSSICWKERRIIPKWTKEQLIVIPLGVPACERSATALLYAPRCYASAWYRCQFKTPSKTPESCALKGLIILYPLTYQEMIKDYNKSARKIPHSGNIGSKTHNNLERTCNHDLHPALIGKRTSNNLETAQYF